MKKKSPGSVIFSICFDSRKTASSMCAAILLFMIGIMGGTQKIVCHNDVTQGSASVRIRIKTFRSNQLPIFLPVGNTIMKQIKSVCCIKMYLNV